MSHSHYNDKTYVFYTYTYTYTYMYVCRTDVFTKYVPRADKVLYLPPKWWHEVYF
jgi:hypothetical protein